MESSPFDYSERGPVRMQAERKNEQGTPSDDSAHWTRIQVVLMTTD